jgi:hypothetical protein
VETATEHRPGEPVDLLRAPVRHDQVGRGRRQVGIGGRADIAGGEVADGGAFDHIRKLHPAQIVVVPRGQEAGLADGVHRRLHVGMEAHAFTVEGWFRFVDRLPVGLEELDRDLLGGIEHGGEGLAAVVRVARPGEERLSIEQLVEDEIKVAAGEQRRSHMGSGLRGPER